MFDADTGLNYLNARYYGSGSVRFLTQDPEFWSFNRPSSNGSQTSNSNQAGIRSAVYNTNSNDKLDTFKSK
jgi:hypothetical protein